MNVYILVYSPNVDEVWGIYATREAAEEARQHLSNWFFRSRKWYRQEIARRHGQPDPTGMMVSEPCGWIEEVELRSFGSLPGSPILGGPGPDPRFKDV